MQNLYYKPSGKSNPVSFLYLALAMVIAAPLLAFIYTYAILYIPIIYLNLLCLAGIALGLGYIANFVIGLGKVRNKILALVLGLLVAFAGLYASWIIWICYHFEIPYMSLISEPQAFIGSIEIVNGLGTWGFRSGGNVDGTMLAIVWIIEALAIIAVPMFFAYTKSCEPYLENDDNWAENTLIGPFEYIPNSGILQKQLETKNYEELLTMKPAENAGQGSHALLEVYHSKKRSQSKEFYLSVKNMHGKINKEGKLEFDEKRLINFIHVTKEAGQQLLSSITSNAAITEIKE